MLGQLLLQRRLQDLLGQVRQHPARAHQIDPGRPRLGDQLPGQPLLLILVEHHGLDDLGHAACSPAKHQPGVSGQPPPTAHLTHPRVGGYSAPLDR